MATLCRVNAPRGSSRSDPALSVASTRWYGRLCVAILSEPKSNMRLVRFGCLGVTLTLSIAEWHLRKLLNSTRSLGIAGA